MGKTSVRFINILVPRALLLLSWVKKLLHTLISSLLVYLLCHILKVLMWELDHVQQYHRPNGSLVYPLKVLTTRQLDMRQPKHPHQPVCLPSLLKAMVKLLGMSRNVIVSVVFVKMVALVMVAVLSTRTVCATLVWMVSLSGLVLIVRFVLVLVIMLGLVMLSMLMIFIHGQSVPTEDPVIVRLVRALVSLDMMV